MAHRQGRRLAKIVDDHGKSYRKYLKRCKKDASEDHIHQLRISIRRLIAVVQLVEALLPIPGLRKARKNLKRQLDAFDRLRDTQVMLITLKADRDELPALDPLVTSLRQSELALLAQTPANIAGFQYRKIGKTLQRVARRFKKSSASIERLTELTNVTFRSVEERYQALEATDADSLHRLRIAVKKYRYLLSAISSLLPQASKPQLSALKNYQDLLGELQNTAVLMHHLDNFFGGELPASIRSHYHQAHVALLDTFWQQKHRILDCGLSHPLAD